MTAARSIYDIPHADLIAENIRLKSNEKVLAERISKQRKKIVSLKKELEDMTHKAGCYWHRINYLQSLLEQCAEELRKEYGNE